MSFLRSAGYERLAQIAGRFLLALIFLVGAYGKIPGSATFMSSVKFTAAAHVPMAGLAVTLAFFLELIVGLALVFGFKLRLAAFVLALYTLLLTLIFHLSFSNQLEVGQFVSHLGLIGGLLYISACSGGCGRTSEE